MRTNRIIHKRVLSKSNANGFVKARSLFSRHFADILHHLLTKFRYSNEISPKFRLHFAKVRTGENLSWRNLDEIRRIFAEISFGAKVRNSVCPVKLPTFGVVRLHSFGLKMYRKTSHFYLQHHSMASRQVARMVIFILETRCPSGMNLGKHF